MKGDSRRQRRDGSAKRVQLTSGDHSGPKGKKGKAPRVMPAPWEQKKAAAKKEWRALFARLAEVKEREAERQQRHAGGGERPPEPPR